MSHIIGIDLGTTNTTLSYVESDLVDEVAEIVPVREFPVPQVIAPGAVEPRATLPSMVYVAGGSELPPDSLHLPWRAENAVAIGHFAREQGARVPTRLIHSSKSWLCHGGVNREKPILPWQSPDEEAKRSPAEVATMILRHLSEAWDFTHPANRMADQEITLCVPASFDAEARNLTVAAAQRAGFKNLHLLEEPQAALYSWVQSKGRFWRDHLRVGDLVLVIDVGGGTSDFSLIAATEENGDLQLRRVAVGEHILLGGDNMDLALAFDVRTRLEKERNVKIDIFQMLALTQQCRVAKEQMLGDVTAPSHPLTILGRGSSVIGGAIRTELPRELLDSLLLEGFLPRCGMHDRPARPKRAGFREAGLPYAADSAITRHLARFVALHQDAIRALFPSLPGNQPVMPTAILFNGGVFHAAPLRQRIYDVVCAWCDEASAPHPKILEGTDLDLAVSRGAAYVGVARRGKGIRIRGGSPRSYYIGFEAPAPAVPGMEPPIKLMCVVPYGMEEGSTVDISGRAVDLCMWKGEPVEFRFFSSTSRRHDAPGAILDHDSDAFAEHSALETTVGEAPGSGEGEALEVDLRSHLTEIGVLELSAIGREAREAYKLEFNVRHFDE